MHNLVIRIEENEATLNISEVQVHLFKDKVSDLGSQLAEKYSFLSGYQERVVLEYDLATALAEADCLTTQYIVGKDLLDSFCTALAFLKRPL